VAPILEQQFSSDSSYVPSDRRDVAESFDTSASRSEAWATPEGYRETQHQAQMQNIDELAARLERANGSFLIHRSNAADSLASSELTTRSTSSTPASSSSSFSSATLESGSIHQRLRFPLHLIMAQGSPGPAGATLGPSSNDLTSQTSEGRHNFPSGRKDGQTLASESSVDHLLSSPSSVGYVSMETKRIYVEEIHMVQDNGPQADVVPEQVYFPLAQETASSTASRTTEPQDDMSAFGRWIATLRGFTPPPTALGSTESADPEGATVTTLSSVPILEILPSPTADISSDSVGSLSDAEQYVWRNIIPPPLDHPDDSPLELPNLIPGLGQGLALSPAAYMEEMAAVDVLAQANDQEQLSIPDSLPSLTPGSISQLEDTLSRLSEEWDDEQYHTSGPDATVFEDQASFNEQDGDYAYYHLGNSYNYYGESTQAMPAAATMQWEGDTAASTASSLSQVVVYSIEEVNDSHLDGCEVEIPQRIQVASLDEEQMGFASLASDSEMEQSVEEVYRIADANESLSDGYVREIPFREMDDPPDNDGIAAASLESVSEIEQGGTTG